MGNMPMDNGGSAVDDEGHHNSGVTRTSDDPGVCGRDPFGNPLSCSGLAKEKSLLFASYELDLANVAVHPWTRISANGAFKAPGLRNLALTAPHFHHGGAATLEPVVEFYNRGGNFALENIADLAPDIQPLGLSATEKAALVDALKALTDGRVRRHAAPFDHPQATVTNGHVGDTSAVRSDSCGRAADSLMLVPAVGRNGFPSTAVPAGFLGLK